MGNMRNIMFGNAVANIFEMRGKGTGPEGAGGTDICVCPECGKEVKHKRGIPCNEYKCFECKVPLTGKGAPGEKKK